jgi:IS30 family transposase
MTGMTVPASISPRSASRSSGRSTVTNRLIREYLPKGTEITTDRGYLATIATEINMPPRHILGFRTPAEVFADLRTSATASTG